MTCNIFERDSKLIREALKRDNYICQCCKDPAEEVHHIQALYLGGKDELDNLSSLCKTCHIYAPKTKEEFEIYKQKGGKVTELRNNIKKAMSEMLVDENKFKAMTGKELFFLDFIFSRKTFPESQKTSIDEFNL